MTVLEGLVEIDSLILDLEGRDYVLSVNAYETLKRKCSQDWEAFKYLQERMHDVRISERARNKMHEVTSESRNKILTGYISCLAVATTATGSQDLYSSSLQVRRQLLNAGALSTLFVGWIIIDDMTFALAKEFTAVLREMM